MLLSQRPPEEELQAGGFKQHTKVAERLSSRVRTQPQESDHCLASWLLQGLTVALTKEVCMAVGEVASAERLAPPWARTPEP